MKEDFDALPYLGQVHAATHISHLFVTATVLGRDPVPPATARVLELGCASGDNLIAMAGDFPQATFVGIDLSAVQIANAKAMASESGLENVTVHHCSVADYDGRGGPFDYIIAHGLFSWVSDEIRAAIFHVIRAHLTPRGIAYVSYNTLPGWHFKTAARDLMRFHSTSATSAADKAGMARAAIEFAKSITPSKIFAETLKQITESPTYLSDEYFSHDLIADDNHPFYLLDFVQMAKASGLSYLGDGEPWGMFPSNYGRKVADALANCDDPVRAEQYLDFFVNRVFRGSLLIHAAGAERETKVVEQLADLARSCHYHARLKYRERRENTDVFFDPEAGSSMSVNDPLMAAVLKTLEAAAPAALSFTDLSELCAVTHGLSSRQVGTYLLGSAAPMFFKKLVRLTVHRPVCAPVPSSHPVARPLARLQARRQECVADAFHRTVPLSPAQRLLLSLLDGTRDRENLHASVSATAFGATNYKRLEDVNRDLSLFADRCLLVA
jgi:methyltransferase-like protein/2-polyprenyl-3-methyl-5-hydroxy-6-metoxy-1,4-benzoquinol methylase